MEKAGERKSNFELLRIVSMMMIFVYHYVVYGGVLDEKFYTINKLAGIFIFVFGRVGVNLFIILSGYFMIESKFKIKKLLKLVFQVFLYSIIMAKITTIRMNNGFEDVFSAFYTPIYHGIYWFVTCYVVVYLISPFLNKMVKSLSEKESKKLIIMGLIILSIVPDIFLLNSFVYTDFIWYLLMYIVGASLRIHNFEFKHKKTPLIITLVYPFVAFATVCILIQINKYSKIHYDKFYYLGLNSIIGFIGTIGIFMLFKNMKIKSNKVINFFAKISFATYLISDHMLYRKVFWNIDCKSLEVVRAPLYMYLGHILLCIIATWLIVGVIEWFRIYVIENLVFRIKIFDKYLNRFDNWMNEI